MAELHYQVLEVNFRPRIHIVEVFPVESASVETKDIEDGANMNVLQYGCSSIDDVPFEKVVSHTLSTSSQKERIIEQKEVIHSISAPLRICSATGFEDSLRDGKV